MNKKLIFKLLEEYSETIPKSEIESIKNEIEQAEDNTLINKAIKYNESIAEEILSEDVMDEIREKYVPLLDEAIRKNDKKKIYQYFNEIIKRFKEEIKDQQETQELLKEPRERYFPKFLVIVNLISLAVISKVFSYFIKSRRLDEKKGAVLMYCFAKPFIATSFMRIATETGIGEKYNKLISITNIITYVVVAFSEIHKETPFSPEINKVKKLVEYIIKGLIYGGLVFAINYLTSYLYKNYGDTEKKKTTIRLLMTTIGGLINYVLIIKNTFKMSPYLTGKITIK